MKIDASENKLGNAHLVRIRKFLILNKITQKFQFFAVP